MASVRRLSIPLLVLLAFAGCAGPLHQGKSPLTSAQMLSDSVVLDMFFVRFPFGDSTVNDKLWEQIDEQQFPATLRERLAHNGFRVGVVSGQMPAELTKLLELADKPAPSGSMETTKAGNLGADPRVVRRHLQLRTGQRSEILASSVYPELPVLMCESGQVEGQTYGEAQGVFAVKSFPQLDGRVRLQLTPELHYGQSRQRWVGDQNMMRLETGRPRKTYDDMTLAAELAPGSMLILTSLPSRTGSLGHYFFTQNDNRLEQKLLVIRLSQTQHDGLFDAPPDGLKLDDAGRDAK